MGFRDYNSLLRGDPRIIDYDIKAPPRTDVVQDAERPDTLMPVSVDLDPDHLSVDLVVDADRPDTTVPDDVQLASYTTADIVADADRPDTTAPESVSMSQFVGADLVADADRPDTTTPDATQLTSTTPADLVADADRPDTVAPDATQMTSYVDADLVADADRPDTTTPLGIVMQMCDFPTRDDVGYGVATSPSGSFSVDLPGIMEEGGLLLLFVGTHGLSTTGTNSAPSGWVAVDGTLSVGDVRIHGQVYARKIDGTEGATVNVPVSNTDHAVGLVYSVGPWFGDIADGVGANFTIGNVTSDPDPREFEAPWGSSHHLWFTAVVTDSGGSSAQPTAPPANYSDTLDVNIGNFSEGVSVAVAQRNLETDAEDPGPWDIDADGGTLVCTMAVRCGFSGDSPVGNVFAPRVQDADRPDTLTPLSATVGDGSEAADLVKDANRPDTTMPASVSLTDLEVHYYPDYLLAVFPEADVNSHFEFDDGNGVLPQDSSPNGYHATAVIGSSPSMLQTPLVDDDGTCTYLNGSQAWELGARSRYDYLHQSYDGTIIAWVRLDSWPAAGDLATVLATTVNSAHGFRLTVDEFGILQAHIRNTNGITTVSMSGARPGGVLEEGELYMVALSMTGYNGTVGLYVNGQLAGQETAPAELAPETDTSLYAPVLGAISPSGTSHFFQGHVEALSTLTRGASGAELQELYELAGRRQLFEAASAYYKLNEASGNFADSSTSTAARLGTAVGTPTYQAPATNLNRIHTLEDDPAYAIHVDGSTDGFTIPLADAGELIDHKWASLWYIKADPQAQNFPCLFSRAGTGSQYMCLWLSDTTFDTRFRLYDGGTAYDLIVDHDTQANLADGSWHRVATLFDPGAEEMRLWIDGTEYGPQSIAGFTSFDFAAANLFVGERGDGAIDEFTGWIQMGALWIEDTTMWFPTNVQLRDY